MTLLEVVAAGEDPGTPLWLGVASFVVAFIAVAISAIGTLATVRDLRRSAPSVEMHAVYTDCLRGYAQRESVTAVLVTLVNRGREPTQVNHFHIGSERAWINGEHNLLDGPKLPFRLEGHAQEAWTIDCKVLDPAPQEVALSLALAHGPRHSEVLRLNELGTGPYRWPRRKRRL